MRIIIIDLLFAVHHFELCEDIKLNYIIIFINYISMFPIQKVSGIVWAVGAQMDDVQQPLHLLQSQSVQILLVRSTAQLASYRMGLGLGLMAVSLKSFWSPWGAGSLQFRMVDALQMNEIEIYILNWRLSW